MFGDQSNHGGTCTQHLSPFRRVPRAERAQSRRWTRSTRPVMLASSRVRRGVLDADTWRPATTSRGPTSPIDLIGRIHTHRSTPSMTSSYCSDTWQRSQAIEFSTHVLILPQRQTALVAKQVELLRRLLTDPHVSFSGSRHEIPDAGINPMPVRLHCGLVGSLHM